MISGTCRWERVGSQDESLSQTHPETQEWHLLSFEAPTDLIRYKTYTKESIEPTNVYIHSYDRTQSHTF